MALTLRAICSRGFRTPENTDTLLVHIGRTNPDAWTMNAAAIEQALERSLEFLAEPLPGPAKLERSGQGAGCARRARTGQRRRCDDAAHLGDRRASTSVLDIELNEQQLDDLTTRSSGLARSLPFQAALPHSCRYRACMAIHVMRRSFRLGLMCAFCSLWFLVACGSPPIDGMPQKPDEEPPPPSTEGVVLRRIELKLLLISATGEEAAFLAARDALDRIGMPYDVLLAATTELTPARLSSDATHCNYRGVIVALGGLPFFDSAKNEWRSAFSDAEWAMLRDYERICSAREVIWYGRPDAELGLTLAESFDATAELTARLTATGTSVFKAVQPSAAIPIRNAFGYKAKIGDEVTTSALLTSADGYTLVARHVAPDGRETLVSTVDTNPYLLHGLVLESDLLSWVSRGLFLGKKRAYLTPQIDDVFLDNNLWNVTTHRNDSSRDGENPFRITGADVQAFIAWQTQLRATLPDSSTYTSVMAFNGLGTNTTLYPDQSLLTTARAAGNNLMWLNHTWDHIQMDAMTTAAARAEVTQNCELARSLSLFGFDCAELVTPELSGLNNASAVQGFVEAGVGYVVSDASLTPAVAAMRGSQPGDNPSFNVGRTSPFSSRLYQIPRHPTDIFFDVATRAAEVDEYNTIYRSYWGRELSYDEIIDISTARGLGYLLIGDVDPLMFHQANLARELVNGVNHSLFSDWIETTATRFTRLVSLPILTLSQREIGRVMQAREAWNACGAQATYIESTVGKTLELRATGSCSIPVTGLSSAAGRVEIYAGVPTTEIAISGGEQKTLALPASQ